MPAEAAAEIRKRFIRTPLPVKEQIALVEAVADAAMRRTSMCIAGPAAVHGVFRTSRCPRRIRGGICLDRAAHPLTVLRPAI